MCNVPAVGLKPIVPQYEAGLSMEPMVCVPSATGTIPQATAAAEPLEDPPGTSRGSSGFTGVPDQAFTPWPDQHSSVRLVLPTILAPDRRAVLTTGASAAACARALKRAGAGHVSVLALARTDRRTMLDFQELSFQEQHSQSSAISAGSER